MPLYGNLELDGFFSHVFFAKINVIVCSVHVSLIKRERRKETKRWGVQSRPLTHCTMVCLLKILSNERYQISKAPNI